MEDETGVESLHVAPEADPVKIRGVAMHAGKISSRPGGASRDRQPSPSMKTGRLVPDAIPNRNPPASTDLDEILQSEGWEDIT